MGRVTIFITDGNEACIRTLAAFRSRKVPVTIINVSKYPKKRDDMVALCMLQSTPQVFFNTRYIGGAEETIALLNEWASHCSAQESTICSNASVTSQSEDGSATNRSTSQHHNPSQIHSRRNSNNTATSAISKHSKRSTTSNHTSYGSVYERYMAEIGNFHDPNDKRLALPSSSDIEPILDESPLPRDPNLEYCITIPGDTSTVLEITQMFIDLIKHEDNTSGSTTYKKSFEGSKVMRVIRGAFEVDEKQAIKMATHFLSAGIFHALEGQSGISFDKDVLYRLQCYQTPGILNSFRIWTENVDNKPLRLIHNLMTRFNLVEISITDKNGVLHPHRAKKMVEFSEFEEAVCELQGVNLTRMNDRTKTAFGINVYNLMVRYASVKLGFVSSSKRASFLSTVKFNIGGHFYTLNEWEHGILRGNAKIPSSGVGGGQVPFHKSDPRLHFIVSNVDVRVLFSLCTNQGPKSCPEFAKYTADNLDEELTITAECFCEKDCNLIIDVMKREVHVSKIFTTYKSEFGKDKNFLPHVISKYVNGIKKKAITSLIDDGKSIKICDISYEWKTPYCTETNSFDSSNLTMESTKGGILSPRKSPTKKLMV